MSRVTRVNIRRGRGGLAGVMILILLSSLGAAACGADDESSMEAIGEDGGGGGDTVDAAVAPRGLAKRASEGTELGGGGSAIPSLGTAVIKTADLRIEVPSDGLRAAVQRVEQIAPRYGGYVHSTTINDAHDSEGVVVIRVPSEDFEVALRDTKSVGKVLGENVSGEDVSQEFVDLDARIRNLEAQESVLLDLMSRATTIADTITVQNNLSGLQLEIERLRGRLNFLEDRTSMGTISVAVVEAGAPAPKVANAFTRAWDQALNILEGLGAGLIVAVIGFVLPLGLVALLALLIYRVLRPRFAR